MIAIEEDKAELNCPTHGLSMERIWKLNTSTEWSKPECSKCEQDQAAEKLRREQEDRLKAEEAGRRQAIQRNLDGSLLPPRFVDKDFAGYVPNGPKAKNALDVCRRYAENFPGNPASLILCGNAGTGKTHLACSIASHVIRQHALSAMFVKTAQAMRKVKETYSRGSELTEQQAINQFKKPDLLILDEVGVQFGTEAEQYIIFEIINERYECLRPTILLSNLALPSLQTFVGERVIDRMKENGGSLLVFDWPSYRNNA